MQPALTVALRSPAFYVGCLGSKRTHAKRVERLKAQGLTDAEIGVTANIVSRAQGENIGAVSAEILAAGPVADITIEDVPLEEIIAELFQST